MNISAGNISKPTPKTPKLIGNAIVFICLAIQPIIAQATDAELSVRAKFYWSIIISGIGAGSKAFTMMLADDDGATDPVPPQQS